MAVIKRAARGSPSRRAALGLQRAARRWPCVRRLHLRKMLGDELDADLAAGESADAGSLCRLCRRLMLFCDLSLTGDAAGDAELVGEPVFEFHHFRPAVS